MLRGVNHKDGRLTGLITFFSLLLILNTLCCFWSIFEVDQYVFIASKYPIQVKTQYLFTSTPPPPSRGRRGWKCKGNVNIYVALPLFIWFIILLSKYGRILLTTFLRFSQFRIFGDMRFGIKLLKFSFQTFPKIFNKFF